MIGRFLTALLNWVPEEGYTYVQGVPEDPTYLMKIPKDHTDVVWDSPLKDIPVEYAGEDHVIWEEIKPEGGKGGFVPSEFNNPYHMDVAFLRLLHRIRQVANVPMKINSDARSSGIGASASAHNARPCRAVDIAVRSSYDRSKIVTSAIILGCRRVGIYPGGEGDASFIHIDAESRPPRQSPRMWTRF
jgi:hypothetical protein